MTVLYRKYRPKTFGEIAGQEHVKAALTNEAATGHIGHSYLFSGPRGVGKTSVARIFAKALNCGARTKEGEPCGTCTACQEIAEGRALDVIEIDAASHTGVDNVREQIIENARFAPSRSTWKVFIIDEVHMLSTSAFNALLKTLEEPPKNVVFILATTELHKLPATIVSRCQRFEFRKVPLVELADRLARLSELEGFSVDRSVLERVARLSEGHLRDAESLLGQVFSLGQKTVTDEVASLILPTLGGAKAVEVLEALCAKDAHRTLLAWEALLVAGGTPARILDEMIGAQRENIVAVVRGVKALSPTSTLQKETELLGLMVRALHEMKRLDPPELAFELLAFEWCAATERASEPPKREPPVPPATPPRKTEEAVPQQTKEVTPPPASEASKESAGGVALAQIKEKWTDILVAAQKRNHGLPYMLGAAELLDCTAGVLTIGFQYAMYRDRLNDKRHRETFEEALAETLGAPVKVKAILVAQRTDGLIEPAPHIQVGASANLPDGFADLVKEFGGTVAAG